MTVKNPIATLHRVTPAIVVALPVRDEAERIGACLTALNQQEKRPDEVVLLLNNCTDATEAIARAMVPSLCFGLDIRPHDFPPDQANAGQARRLAMALAARRAGPHGVVMTSDADGVVAPDWVARNLAGLQQGADLVCGCAVVHGIEADQIPAHLHADDVLERRLIALIDRMAWALDPDPHNPPPRHTEASGASLAVRVAAFDRVGGVPPVASGEDRAFVEALRRIDARIRHDPAIEVAVSGRIVGRAEGGMADAIRRRMVRQDEYTDDQVEPAKHAVHRLTARSRVRAAWSTGAMDRTLAADLALDPAWLAGALAEPFFGAAWAMIEAHSAMLQRQRVRFTDLPAEIATATQLLAELKLPETLVPEILVPETMAAEAMAAE